MRDNLWAYVYNGETLFRSNVMRCVGDTVEDYIVWQVDYRNRIIYLAKV